MTINQHQVGSIKVNLPDENQNYFSIFEDLAKLFGDEFQSGAVKKLREKLKDVKPKASIDYESNYTHITTLNVDTLLLVINAIIELSDETFKQSFSQINQVELNKAFTNAKYNRPKPKEWQTGDVFAIPLLDNTFAFGQILDKKYCTCVLFDLQLDAASLNREKMKTLRPISVLHLSNGDLLNNGHWKIIYNQTVTLNPNNGRGGKFGDIGSESYGQCGVMEDLANAYFGLIPWNVMYDENYYDELLLKGVIRPNTAIVLNQVDRTKYRKEKYGIE